MSGVLQATFTGTTGGSQTQADPVVITPDTGSAGDSVTLSTITSGAHIFYTATQTTGVNPTHSGDNPTGVTIRIGSSSGSISAPGSVNKNGVIRALAYKAGLIDSIISEGNYSMIGGPE